MNTIVYSSYAEFCARGDQKLNGVSSDFAGRNRAFAEQNVNNEACWNCSRCSGCSDCFDLKNARPVASDKPAESWFDVPVIPNIHARVLAAVENPGALDMAAWHTCETTHCRAGLVVTLAGDKGRKLEAASSTMFAAMQIYHASSPSVPVSPVRFFDKNEVALADIVRCAKAEGNTP